MLKRKRMKNKKADNLEVDKQSEINIDDQATEEQSETDKLEELGQKLEEMNDKFLRLYSEFENYRKRTAKEKIEMIKFASQDAITDLLPVVDDYERALEDLDGQQDIPETVVEGIKLIYNKLTTYLTKKGVKEIEAKGEEFDENYHEAISQFPAQEEDQKGNVVDVVLKGYTMHDKVIRYSKVVVGI